jgi:hypothetical protein
MRMRDKGILFENNGK